MRKAEHRGCILYVPTVVDEYINYCKNPAEYTLNFEQLVWMLRYTMRFKPLV